MATISPQQRRLVPLAEGGAIALLFAFLAIVMTWPLARNLASAAAYPGDPYINTWVLDWDWYATFHHPLSLFDANAFFPARYALAYSENIYGIAIVLFPLRAFGMAPLTAYNVAMLGGFAFSGMAACLLGRYVTGSAAAGIAGGIFYAFVPFRFTHLTHVQHMWAGWLPILILLLLHHARRPSWARAALFGAAFLMNGLTNIHWLLFGSLAIALSVPLVRRMSDAGARRFWLPLAAATLAAMLLLTPFLAPYWNAAKLYGMERNWSETMSYSAVPSSWLVSSLHNHLYGAATNDGRTDPELWLFPGILSILFAGAGIVLVRDRGLRPAVSIAILWAALGFVGSLGLHTIFHRFLFLHVPGFRSIRVPARWAMIAYTGMAILIACAVAAILRRMRGRRVRGAVATIISISFLFELNAAPIRWYQAPNDVPPVYRWLAHTDVGGGTLELPMDENGSEYLYLFRATAHHSPILNGVSGFVPPEYVRISTLVHETPASGSLVGELRRIGCRAVIIHADLLGDRAAATRDWLRREVDRGQLTFVRRFDAGVGGDWLFALDAASAQAWRPPGTPDLGGLTPDAQLEVFLRGGTTCGNNTFGVLDYPRPGERLKRGPVLFSGWALSPYGIREVDLLFENGAVRVPAKLIEDRNLKWTYPCYPETPNPRFLAPFAHRLKGVRRNTDVQVEIVDGRGKRVRLESEWIYWP